MSDVFPSLDSLKRELRRKRDYRIRYRNRKSIATVIAPHGGFIDEGTSAIAGAIASSDFNLFDFQGLIEKDSYRLHVTSHRFKDRQLSKLLDRSRFAVSIHGMHDATGKPEIWLGGLNFELKMLIGEALVAEGFAVNLDPPKYKGEHLKNVVNLPPLRGVQLELPAMLRTELFQSKRFRRDGRRPQTTKKFDSLVRAVRDAMLRYERSLSPSMVAPLHSRIA